MTEASRWRQSLESAANNENLLSGTTNGALHAADLRSALTYIAELEVTVRLLTNALEADEDEIDELTAELKTDCPTPTSTRQEPSVSDVEWTGWLIEETWISPLGGGMLYVHENFHAEKWRAEMDRIRDFSRRRQPFLTKDANAALRFDTEAEANKWLSVQPRFIREGSQYQPHEHMALNPREGGARVEEVAPKHREVERFRIWREVQLMGAAGLEQTEEESPAWNLFAAIHSFAVGQQLGERTEPMNQCNLTNAPPSREPLAALIRDHCDKGAAEGCGEYEIIAALEEAEYLR